MTLNLDRLEQLQAEWKSLQPLEPARDERLWQKLRLLWNFHSNHIEGNTLTYGETELLLLHGKASGAHDLRDYEEMKSHDVAIAHLRMLANAKEELTEVDVRELNLILLKEPFFKYETGPAGEAMRTEIVPGRYKLEANKTRTATGDIFEFVLPDDVPIRMPRLIQAIRASIGKEGLELIASLAFTHHEFVYIHPFDDGNGRTARLLTNYILLKKGLPPLVIPTERRKDYLNALDLANGGDMETLSDFLAEQLIWALELGIRAGKGESLEEPSDIEKEIALFVREKKAQKKQVLKKNPDLLRTFLKTSVQPLFNKLDEKTQKIGELFESRQLCFRAEIDLLGTLVEKTDLRYEELVDHIGELEKFELTLSLKGYCGKASYPFAVTNSVRIQLGEYEYRIGLIGFQERHAVYSEVLDESIADKIVSQFLKQLLESIKLESR